MLGPISAGDYVLTGSAGLMTMSISPRSISVTLLVPGSQAHREISRFADRLRSAGTTASPVEP